MRWVLGYAAALCVLVLIVCEAIAFPTFFKPFYSREYDKYNIPETIQVEKNELMRVTGELLDYMHGRRADLSVPATVNGEPREFFNDKEKAHMADVWHLFEIGFKVRNITCWLLLLLILLMIFVKARVIYVLARCCREILTGFLLLTGLLSVIIALDFNRAFNIFHTLFFSNDLWQLNPDTDLLINIVPQGFFIDIALFIGVLIVSVSVIIIGLSTLYLRRVSRAGYSAERI